VEVVASLSQGRTAAA